MIATILNSCEYKTDRKNYTGTYVLKYVNKSKLNYADTLVIKDSFYFIHKTLLRSGIVIKYIGKWQYTVEDYLEFNGYHHGYTTDTLSPSNWDFRPFSYGIKSQIRIAVDRDFGLYYIKVSNKDLLGK